MLIQFSPLLSILDIVGVVTRLTELIPATGDGEQRRHVYLKDERSNIQYR
jgi:hypothetical protein